MRTILPLLLALACTADDDKDPVDSGEDSDVAPEATLCERMLSDPVEEVTLDANPLPELLVADTVIRVTLNGGGWATFTPDHLGTYQFAFSEDLTIMPLDPESYPVYPVVAQADCEGVHHFETYDLEAVTYQVLFSTTAVTTVDIVSAEIDDDGLSL